jgi:hypothetical protein
MSQVPLQRSQNPGSMAAYSAAFQKAVCFFFRVEDGEFEQPRRKSTRPRPRPSPRTKMTGRRKITLETRMHDHDRRAGGRRRQHG